MNDINLSINIFAVIDDIIKSIEIDPKTRASRQIDGIRNINTNDFTSNIKTRNLRNVRRNLKPDRILVIKNLVKFLWILERLEKNIYNP